MLYDSDLYELSSINTNNELLSDFPLDLIKENILEQIEYPLTANTDYYSIVLEKYGIIKKNFADDPDSFKEFENMIRDLSSEIVYTISNKLNLGIDSNLESHEIFSITEAVYNYYILRYKKNIIKFFYRYIKNYKKDIVDQYERMSKKKDVTTLNYKKQLKNKDDIIILSNLPSIIMFIKSLSVESEEFINITMDIDNIDDRQIKYLITQGILSGDFVDTYLDIVFDSNDNILDELLLDIKMKLFKKSS